MWVPPNHEFELRKIAPLIDHKLWLHRADYLNARHGWDAKCWGKLNREWPFYTDGSCMNPSHGLLARAAFAIIQIDPTTGELTYYLVVNVDSDDPQTAAMAEQLAATWTLHLLYNTQRLPLQVQEATAQHQGDSPTNTPQGEAQEVKGPSTPIVRPLSQSKTQRKDYGTHVAPRGRMEERGRKRVDSPNHKGKGTQDKGAGSSHRRHTTL